MEGGGGIGNRLEIVLQTTWPPGEYFEYLLLDTSFIFPGYLIMGLEEVGRERWERRGGRRPKWT